MANERLDPRWIVAWLRDPQALQPGTNMPSFYDFSDDQPDGPEDILGGDDEKQVVALRDYLLTLYKANDEAAEPGLAGRPTAETDGSAAN